MKKLVFVGVTLLLSLLIFGSATELLVRTIVDDGMQYDLEMWKYAVRGKRISAEPEIGHEHVPGARFHAMGVDVAINAHGMRGPEVGLAKPPGTYRVMMLGDSLTFGWGVAGEETVARRLQGLLEDAGIAAQVLNTGVGNTNTTMQVAYFRSRGAAFDPDVVVLNYFINDVEPTPHSSEPSFIQRHSYALNYLNARLDVLFRMVDSRQDWFDYYRGLYFAENSLDWERTHSAIEALAEQCRELGIPLLLVNYPEIRQLRDYPFKDVSELVAKAAQDARIEYLDLLPAVADIEPSKLWVTRPDPHPNGYADAFFARSIFDKLASMGFPGRPRAK